MISVTARASASTESETINLSEHAELAGVLYGNVIGAQQQMQSQVLHQFITWVTDSPDSQFRNSEAINEFPAEPYRVLKPIIARIRSGLPGYEASFPEANIAWIDESREEAISGLRAEVLNTLEDYEEHEAVLGPEPRRQLNVLREYIAHARQRP